MAKTLYSLLISFRRSHLPRPVVFPTLLSGVGVTGMCASNLCMGCNGGLRKVLAKLVFHVGAARDPRLPYTSGISPNPLDVLPVTHES